MADDRDFWRRGHRRPWWQWNVITLFVALFVLVWVRELAPLSQTTSWAACLIILALWVVSPAIVMEGGGCSVPFFALAAAVGLLLLVVALPLARLSLVMFMALATALLVAASLLGKE